MKVFHHLVNISVLSVFKLQYVTREQYSQPLHEASEITTGLSVMVICVKYGG
mgnify:CR=1 FL=1|jgi:hypothetical protein